MTAIGRHRATSALGVVLLAFVLSAGAAERPPPQGTRLLFQKTLFVQKTPTGKVFAETRQVASDDTLWKILTRDYGIPETGVGAFLNAFRTVNPGVNPDRIHPGQVVRIPFKIEERLASDSKPEASRTYTVRPGDNLWKVLRRTYDVPRERMGAALREVARANPRIPNLDRLWVGQRVVIPSTVKGPSEEAGSRAPKPVRPAHRSVLALLGELGCRVTTSGETFLPMGRGRTLRLDAREFPLVTGPTGNRVLLDTAGRLPPALAANVRQKWGYGVVSGVDDTPEAYLDRVLPLLGLHELSEGVRIIPLGNGADLVALVRWTVVPRPEDLWEGRIHLIFAPDATVDPALAAMARAQGFALHRLGATVDPRPRSIGDERIDLPQLDGFDPIQGVAELLSILGIPHQVDPEIDCALGGGVRYRVIPRLTFRHGGLRYAVPPERPARAGQVLVRAGYFTVGWPPGAATLDRIADLLSLLGVPHTRSVLEVPPEGALRIRAGGLVLDHPELAGLLYPGRSGTTRIFLTAAPLDPATARSFLRQGVLPWVLKTGP